MSTNRTYRARNRRPNTSDNVEQFFKTGTYEKDSDHIFEIFDGRESWLYEAWVNYRDRIGIDKARRTIGWKVLESGTLEMWPRFSGLSKKGYEQWKSKQEGAK